MPAKKKQKCAPNLTFVDPDCGGKGMHELYRDGNGRNQAFKCFGCGVIVPKWLLWAWMKDPDHEGEGYKVEDIAWDNDWNASCKRKWDELREAYRALKRPAPKELPKENPDDGQAIDGCQHVSVEARGEQMHCTDCNLRLDGAEGPCRHEKLPRDVNGVCVQVCRTCGRRPHCIKPVTDADGNVTFELAPEYCQFKYDPSDINDAQCLWCMMRCGHKVFDETWKCVRCGDPNACPHAHVEKGGKCKRCGDPNGCPHFEFNDKQECTQCGYIRSPGLPAYQVPLTHSEGAAMELEGTPPEHTAMELDAAPPEHVPMELDAAPPEQAEGLEQQLGLSAEGRGQDTGGTNDTVRYEEKQKSPGIAPGPGPMIHEPYEPPVPECRVCKCKFVRDDFYAVVDVDGRCVGNVCFLDAMNHPIWWCCSVAESTSLKRFEVRITGSPGGYPFSPKHCAEFLKTVGDQVIGRPDSYGRINPLSSLTTAAFHAFHRATTYPPGGPALLAELTAKMMGLCVGLAQGSVAPLAVYNQIDGFVSNNDVGKYVKQAWDSVMHNCAVIGANRIKPCDIPVVDTSACREKVEQVAEEAIKIYEAIFQKEWKAKIMRVYRKKIKALERSCLSDKVVKDRKAELKKDTKETLEDGVNAKCNPELAKRIEAERAFHRRVLGFPACMIIMREMDSSTMWYYDTYKSLPVDSTGNVRYEAMAIIVTCAVGEIFRVHAGGEGIGFSSSNTELVMFMGYVMHEICAGIGMSPVSVPLLNTTVIEQLGLESPTSEYDDVNLLCSDEHRKTADLVRSLELIVPRIMEAVMKDKGLMDSPVTCPVDGEPLIFCCHESHEGAKDHPVGVSFLPSWHRDKPEAQLSRLSDDFERLMWGFIDTPIPGLRMGLLYVVTHIAAAIDGAATEDKDAERLRLCSLVVKFIHWAMQATLAVVLGRIMNGSLVRSIGDYKSAEYEELMKDSLYHWMVVKACETSDAHQDPLMPIVGV